jgi:hypothetical protein
MTFDPDSITPPEDLIAENTVGVGTCAADCIFFARWGAAQAVKALRHQWPEPITDRPPAEADGDERGFVQFLFSGTWAFCCWENAAKNQHQAWLHSPRWRPNSEPTPKERALKMLSKDSKAAYIGFNQEQIALICQVVESAPDITP